MTRRARWLWIGGGALLLVLFVVGGLLRPKPGRAVQVATVSRQRLVALVKAPAKIEPKVIVNISAELPGRVTQLAVVEGQHVRRGQMLLRLESTNYAEQVRQAQAMLASSQAHLRASHSAWAAAQPNYTRRKALFAQKLLSNGEMEAAEREYQAARSDYDAAQEEVARTEAALRAARDQFSKTIYNSPIDGTVIGVNVEQGEIVMIGTMNNPGTRILSVADLDRMLAKADVDETDVVDLRVGQPVTIEIDAMPDTSFKGHVTEIAHSATSQAVGSSASGGETDFEVKVLFDDKVPAVRPGMTADVSIETAHRDSALAVPIQSVVTRSAEDLKRGNKKRGGFGKKETAAAPEAGADKKNQKEKDKTGVFVLVGNRVEFREVTTGIASETDIEVKGAVQPGDKVVTGPYQILRDLRPGQQVKIEKPGQRTTRRT